MTPLENYFNHHAFGFWIALLAAVVLLAAWMLLADLRSRRTRAHNEEVLRSVEAGNIPAMLAEYLMTVRGVDLRTAETNQQVAQLRQVLPSLLRHVGLVRFSPFHDTGGDQSFSLAILDSNGDGVVLSGLHSRREHRLYAKPVVRRESSYPLTVEERRAIEAAVTVGIVLEPE